MKGFSNRIFNQLIPFGFLLIMLLSFNGCGSSDPCDACEGCEDKCAAIEEKMEPYDDLNTHQLVSEFHAMVHGPGTTMQDDSIDVFVDLSQGMLQPLKSDRDIKMLFADLRNNLQSESKRYYKVTGEAIEPMPKMSEAELDNFFFTEKNFKYAYSPLDKAINRIASRGNRQSIFITDGEYWTKAHQYKGGNHSYAWAAKPFQKWLEMGNEIDFIIRSFKPKRRRGISQMRYMMIFFTPKAHAAAGKSQINRFRTKLENSGKSNLVTHLNFSRNAYILNKLNPHGLPDDERGLNSVIVSNWEYNHMENAGLGYEHIHYDGDLGDFQEFIADFVDGNYDEEVDRPGEKNKLFYDLEITNKFVNFDILDLEVRTSDITKSLQDFRMWKRCWASDSVVVTEDEESNKKKVVWCNPEYSCYAPDKICGEFITEPPAMKDIFTLHDEFYANWKPENKSKGNIAIRPAKNFDFDGFYEAQHFKIDIVIKNARYKEAPGFELLAWRDESENYPEIKGLQESVKEAVGKVDLSGHLIYTYYITTDEL